MKVTAWVDRGIAPLVAVLDGFDGVLTLDSCQGESEKGAYVLFHVRGDGLQAARFASDLAGMLGEKGVPPYVLQAEWRAGEGEPLLALSCPRDSVATLAEALSAARRKLSGDGMRHRALHS